jgi:hypothetical protein
MGSAALLLGISLSVWTGPVVGHEMAPPVAAHPVPLAGIYECQGTGADGRVYRGAVIIEPDGNRFLVQWYVASELTAVGIGIRDGDMLAVSFFSADNGGVVLYRIDGAKLAGHWSAPLSDGEIFEETLTRVSDIPPAPAQTPPATPRPSGARPVPGSRPIHWVQEP